MPADSNAEPDRHWGPVRPEGCSEGRREVREERRGGM